MTQQSVDACPQTVAVVAAVASAVAVVSTTDSQSSASKNSGPLMIHAMCRRGQSKVLLFRQPFLDLGFIYLASKLDDKHDAGS